MLNSTPISFNQSMTSLQTRLGLQVQVWNYGDYVRALVRAMEAEAAR